MSRGNPHLSVRVESTLFTQVTTMAQRRGVHVSIIVREALLTFLASDPHHDGQTAADPRVSPASDHPSPTPQTLTAAFLPGLNASTQAQFAEGMSRFQCSAIDLARVILRQWAATMKDPRRWRVWRP